MATFKHLRLKTVVLSAKNVKLVFNLSDLRFLNVDLLLSEDGLSFEVIQFVYLAVELVLKLGNFLGYNDSPLQPQLQRLDLCLQLPVLFPFLVEVLLQRSVVTGFSSRDIQHGNSTLVFKFLLR